MRRVSAQRVGEWDALPEIKEGFSEEWIFTERTERRGHADTGGKLIPALGSGKDKGQMANTLLLSSQGLYDCEMCTKV